MCFATFSIVQTAEFQPSLSTRRRLATQIRWMKFTDTFASRRVLQDLGVHLGVSKCRMIT